MPSLDPSGKTRLLTSAARSLHARRARAPGGGLASAAMYFPRSFARCAIVALLVSIVPAAALAAPSPKEKAEAKTLVDNAKKALKEKRFSDAMAALKQASTLDPGPAIELELGQAEMASGKLLDASKRLTAVATADGDGSPASKAARDGAKKALAELTLRVPSVKVAAKGPTGKVSVTIDGAEVSAGSDESVDPGEHTIAVNAEGFARAERKVTIAEGAHETVEIALEPAGGKSSESSIMPRLPGIIVTGVGGVTMLIGGVLGGLAIGATSDAKAGCVNNVCPNTAARRDLVSKAKTLGNASTGMLIAGGVVAAGGVVLIVLTPFSKKKEEAPKGASIRPWIGADQIGVMGTF